MSRASRRRSGGSLWVRLDPAEIALLCDHHEALARDLRQSGQDRAADRLEVRALELRLASTLPGERGAPQ